MAPSPSFLDAAVAAVSPRRRPILFVVVVLVLGWVLLHPSTRIRLTYEHSPLPSRPPPHPFALPGTLSYNKTNPFLTTWTPRGRRPYSAVSTRPPRLMEKLMLSVRGRETLVQNAVGQARASRGTNAPIEDDDDPDEDLEWLRGRTVLLLGDSLDRYHLLHLCQFLSPSAPLHPVPWPHSNPQDFVKIYSPSTTPYRYPAPLVALEKEYAAKYRNGKPYGSPQSRPWVCEIKKYDAWIMWGFLNGLDDGETTPGLEVYEGEEEEVDKREVEEHVQRRLIGDEGTWGEKARNQPFGDRAFFPIESEHFNLPLSSESRLDEILLPLLHNTGRGSPRSVDMVEFGVGAWDLGMFRTQDSLAIQRHLATSNLPASNLNALAQNLTATPVSPARMGWFEDRLKVMLRKLVEVFPENHPGVSRVRVRTMPVPPQWYKFPWVLFRNRVLQIEEKVKEVVREFEEKEWEGRGVEYNGWAEMVRGAEGGKAEWLDHIHPGPVPASWLWADGMLYELRKIVTGIE